MVPVPDPAQTHISHFRLGSVFFLPTKSTPEDKSGGGGGHKFWSRFCALILFFSPSFLLRSGGFWTRFSGLFGQVERDPEEAEFQLRAGLRLHFHCRSHSRPSDRKAAADQRGQLPVGTFRSKTPTLKTLKPFKKETLKTSTGDVTRASTPSFCSPIK